MNMPGILASHADAAPWILALGLSLSALAWTVRRARRTERTVRLEVEERIRALDALSETMRTPVSVALAALELLRRTRLSPHQAELADLVQAAGAQLADLARKCAVPAESSAVLAQRTHIASLAREVIDLHRPGALAKGIYLQLDVAEPLADELRIDAQAIREVLSELVCNAVKCTESGGVHVRLSTDFDRHANRLRLAVRDSGCGIGQDRLTGLFESVKPDPAADAGHDPGGVESLAACRRRVIDLGGTLGVRSVSGQGTEVSVQVPVDLATGQGLPEDARRAARLSGLGAQVLVVAGQPAYRQVLALQLRELGYRCAFAHDGDAAVAMLRRESFSAVLLDCALPGLDTFEWARRWRAIEVLEGHTPTTLVAVSAEHDQAHRDRCLGSGLDRSLAKPWTLQNLAQSVATADPAPAMAAGTDDPSALLTLFLAACEADLKAVLLALRDQDRVSAIHHAHRIHGAALMVDASIVAEQSGSLEQSLRDGLSWSQGLQRAQVLGEALQELRTHP
jgi:two-component system sensor histidine kinase EvgS